MGTSNVDAVYDSNVGNHARFVGHDVVNLVFSVSIKTSPCPSPPCTYFITTVFYGQPFYCLILLCMWSCLYRAPSLCIMHFHVFMDEIKLYIYISSEIVCSRSWNSLMLPILQECLLFHFVGPGRSILSPFWCICLSSNFRIKVTHHNCVMCLLFLDLINDVVEVVCKLWNVVGA